MNKILLYTMGFTQKTAEQFFNQLIDAGVKRVIDIRLHNSSQLAGFTKQEDLKYFLKIIGHIDYEHRQELAPTQEILNEYKKSKGKWTTYKKQFLDLLATRKVSEKLFPETFHQACLLCSEPTPKHCHRSLVAKYLSEQWGNVEIKHIL